ncbi:MAG: biotin/lipoyl-binding protein [Hyphomicrobiales bacterium]|nr:biotin/lipoyl-binding protein [Hyphomicrobiales bacterium]
MNWRILLPLLGALGFAAAIVSVVRGDQPPPTAAAPLLAAHSPYKHYVAGTGLIEASNGNIALGTPVSGIVGAIYVKWGEEVAAGTPLFKIDDRDLAAQLVVAQAGVRQAEAHLAKTKNLLKVGQGLQSGASISAVELANRRFDADIADAALGVAEAQVARIKVDIERRIIRAPVAGRVLQINMHLGEFAPSGAVNPPLMLFGDDKRLNIRVDVDEFDAWRVRPDAPAIADAPGNPDLKTKLRFLRIERYVVPKTSLTGASTERTDTRVLQVIYSFDHGDLPLYVGQRMNVFIEAPQVPNGSGDGRPRSRADSVVSERGERNP